MADSDTIRRLWLLKSDLEELPDDEKLIQILKKLLRLPVSIRILQETGIGKVVNSFRKREGIAGKLVQRVVNSWKAAVQNEVKYQEENEKRESSQESEGSNASIENSSSDGEDKDLSSGNENPERNRHGAYSESSEEDEIPRKIKKERSSSSDRELEQEDKRSRKRFREEGRRHRKRGVDGLKMNGVHEDDLTDSDLEGDVGDESTESNIESYYHKMLGQMPANENDSENSNAGRKDDHYHRKENKQSVKKSSSSDRHSSSSLSLKHKKDSRERHNESFRVHNKKHEQKRKSYHSVSDSDEEEDVETCHRSVSPNNHSHSYGSSSVKESKVYDRQSLPSGGSSLNEKRSSSLSYHKGQSNSSPHKIDHKHTSSTGEKYHKHSSSSSGEKLKSSSSLSREKYKSSSSSSGEKHKSSPSSSGEKHKSSSSSSGEKHKSSSSSSGEKHKSSSSSSVEKHKSSSSSSGEKHKSSSSSSGEKHKSSSSSSGEKHKSSSSSSGEKHKSSSSSSGEKHKSLSSLSSEKHQKSLSSSSSHEKHKSSSSSSEKPLSSSSAEKHRSSSSSPGEKHHKHSSSSSGEKHHKHSSSSSGEKHHKHSSSSSGEKEKHSFSSTGGKHDKHSSSSSGEKYHQHSSSLSGEKQKHSSSSSGEKYDKHTSSPSGEKHHKHTISSTGEKYHKRSSSSSGEKQKHSSSSDEKRHKHSLSSSGDKQKSSSSSLSSGNFRHNGDITDKMPKAKSQYAEYSHSPVRSPSAGKETEEDVNEYVPTFKGILPVEYVPSKKIKLEAEDNSYTSSKTLNKDSEKNKYIEALHKNYSDDNDSDRYSPTIGWKIKKEKTVDDHKYGGGIGSQNLSVKDATYQPSTSSSPVSYIPSRKIKQEKEDDDYVDNEHENDCSPNEMLDDPVMNIKQENVNYTSAMSSYANGSSDSDDDEEKYEKRSKIHLAKPAVKSSSDKYSSHHHSPSSRKSKESLSYKPKRHEYSEEKHDSSQKRKKEDVTSSHRDNKHKVTSSSSSSLSSHKNDHLSNSSHKDSKISSSSLSSSKEEKNSTHSHRKGKLDLKDGRSLKENKQSSSNENDSYQSHSKKKDVNVSHKSNSSHSGSSSVNLPKSDKHRNETKEHHKPTSKSSTPASSNAKHSSSASKSKSHGDQKKRKENIFTDDGLDLFSDTIQIKAEPSPPPSRPRDSKHSSVKSSEPSRAEKTKRIVTTPSPVPTWEDETNGKDIVNGFCGAEEDSPKQLTNEETKEYRPEKKKKRKSSYHLDEAGMSFDDFLNFDEAAVLKKRKTPSKQSTKPTHKPSKSSSSHASGSGMSTSLNSRLHADGFALFVPAPPKNVSVTENDILSILPETQAFYRPLRPNPLYDRDEESFEPVDTDVIVSKTNVRSKVYSGRKHVIKEMKPLYDLCLQVLIDNIDALDYVGGVPYSILKPVLERCSATQLYQLEDCNPHFLEDSDELWELHCQRDFRGADPDEMETWRELYLRKFEEREAKYQKLKASMSSVVTKGQAGRHAKLAFVDSVAKPPREVLRQQKRYGTGCVVKAGRAGKYTKDSGSAVRSYKPSLSVPAHNPMNDRPRMIKATPPMMARALQMRKNMRR